MSKKILFMSSAKLTAISIGLLLAVFCTIGMSFRPVYDEDEAAEIVMSGQKRSHWTTSSSSCGTTTYTYHNTRDFGKVIAHAEGGGTVSATGTNAQSASSGNSTATATVTWNCGLGKGTGGATDNSSEEKDDVVTLHTNEITFVATPNPGYRFMGWYTAANKGGERKDDESATYSEPFMIDGANYDKGNQSDANTAAGNHLTAATAQTWDRYAYFEAIPTVAVTFLAPSTASENKGNYVFTINGANTTVTTSDVNRDVNLLVTLTANPLDAYYFEYWYTEDAGGNRTIVSTSNPLVDYSFDEATKIGAQLTARPTHFDVTFKAVELDANDNPIGSYMVNSTTVTTSDYIYNTGDAYSFSPTLTATPATGYLFNGWYTKEGKKKTYLSTANPYNATIEGEMDVYADFVFNNYTDDQKAQFKVGSTYYTDLNAANSAASSGSNKTIVCTRDGVLPPGNYTISSGVTLYIPYSTSETSQTAPALTKYDKTANVPALSCYRKLTMVNGANIVCSGKICVGGQIAELGGGYFSGYPFGACGMLDMSRGGHIELNSGAVLYAWGFIKGQDMDQGNNTVEVGTITANSGAKVYEDFSGENRGGSACKDLADNRGYRTFPFQGYAIQNIEVPVTYKYGSTLQVYTALYIQGNITKDFPLISSENALFLLKDSQSSVKKWYDPTTDLACYELSGTAKLDAIKTNIYIEINSADYNLPIASNMHIILNDCNMTLSNPIQILPDAIIEIKAGATVNLVSNLYLYDVDEWQKGVAKLYFASFNNLTNHKNRGDGSSKENLQDARLIVDGKLNVTGKIYSTTSGANIMGNGGGRISFPSTLASSGNLYQLWGAMGGTSTSTSITISASLADDAYLEPVPVNSANLCNEDSTYTKAVASTTFHNVHGRWFAASAKDGNDDHTYDFTYIVSGAVSGTSGTNVYPNTHNAVYSWDKKAALELTQKWHNVAADACANWRVGTDTYFYNWTLESDWHQFIPTATEGMYSGSNNKIYTKTDCDWEELGETDVNCLYEIGGVKKALVDGQFIALEPNNNDPAYHAADDASQYYICFEGCNWHAADKYAEAEKAYIIAPDTFIWYNNAWMSVNFQEPFAYTMSETNVPIYYEYLNGEWVLAEPYVRVVDGLEDRSYYFIEDAFKFANSVLRTSPTITILRDISARTAAMSYTAANKTCTLDLNGNKLTLTVVGAGTSAIKMFNINAAGTTFTITDSSEGANGEFRLIAAPNTTKQSKRWYGVYLTNGTLVLNAGKIYAEDNFTYTSTSDAGMVSGVGVAAGMSFTMNDGTIEAYSKYAAYGVDIAGSTSANATVKIKGGTIHAETTQVTTAYGMLVAGGTTTITGGKIEARAKTTTAIGVAVTANANGYYGTLKVEGGEIDALTTTTTCYGVQVGEAIVYSSGNIISNRVKSEATISRGTIRATSTTTKSSSQTIGVRSFGTTTITGGTIDCYATQSIAYGVYAMNGTTTISGTPTIIARAPTYAYGACAGSTPADKTGVPYNGNLEISGGRFDVSAMTTTTAYGVLVQALGRAVNYSTSSGYYPGNYVSAGSATISGGEFDVQAHTTTAYGIYVKGAITQTGAKLDADGNLADPVTSNPPTCSVTGGKFKTSGTGSVFATNDAALIANYQVTGGYYSHDGNLASYTPSPKHVLTLPADDSNRPPYYYKVAEAYLVTFKTEDGAANIIDPVYQEVGTQPVCSTEPTKESTSTNSFTFDGWATEANGAKVYEPNGLPNVTSAGATYYAHFATTTLKYRVHFDAATNGGECATENIYVNPSSAISTEIATLPTATKYGYTFNGWYTAASSGTKITTATVPTADVTYYAQFTVNSHTLTWDLAGGTVSTAGKIGSTTWPAKNATGTQSRSVAYGTVLTTIPVVTKTGYTFNRWDPVPGSSMPDADVTYTAIWTPKTNTAYTVKHYQQNVDGTYPTDPLETEAFTGTTATSVTPEVKSYEGFVSPATQTVTIAAAGTTVVEYRYARRHYTFTLDAYTNGGMSEVPSIEVLHGATIGAVPPDAQKGCNDFTGWYTKPVGGDKITSSFVIEYDMKTLYAQFSDDVRTYTITYLAGANGTGTVAAGTKTCGEDATLSSSTFTRDGYAQTGWSLTDGDAQAYALGGTYTENASLTLYPFWTLVGYQINFVDEDGTTTLGDYPKTLNPGATVTAPTEPTKAQTAEYTYTFAGWSDGTNTYTSDAIPSVTAGATYTATYTATPNVASVTVGGATTYYTTIDAAFEYVNTASANMTITMLANATAAASLVYQPTSTYTCTLDLNNHTISGSVAKLIDINLAKSTFIITDNSVAKGGKVDNNYNENARAYGVFLTAGTFKLQNGTISSTNPHTYSTASANKNSAASAVYVTAGQTFTMDNGTVESASQYASYAIYMARGTSTVTINNGLVKGRTTKSTTAAGIYNLGKGLTVNGGRIIGHAYTTTAYGIYLYGGSGTIKGGTIEATNDTTSSKGTTTTYGIYVNYYNGTYKGVLTIPSTSTVNVLAKARTTTSYAIVVGGSSTGSTIAGGTFTAKTMTGKTAYCINSSGNITISGGTFNANAATTTAYGLYSARGTITVSGNPTFNVTSGTSTAYGALAYGTIGKKGTGKYSGTIKINGGTFNVTSTSTDAYGALAGLASRDLRSCSATNDTVPGLHYMPGILEITNGTFNVKAKTTVAYGVHVVAAKNESGDVGTTTRIPLGTITGGKFKVESMGDANATAYAMTTTTTAARLVVQGGYYSTKAISATANIEDKYTAPMKEDCNYYVLDLPSSELPYKYEVAEAYNITFKDGDNTTIQEGPVKKGVTPAYTGETPTKTEDANYTYTFNNSWEPAIVPATAAATYTAQFDAVSKETGFWLDIIDVDNANHKLVVNAGNYAHWPEWPYSINGETYYANTASGTPARDEKNRLEINYGNLEPGAEFPITITKDATVTSKHTYIIPQEVTIPVTLSDNAPRSIFVKGTTLTIDGDVETKNIYVGDDAKLVINEGKTLTADTVFLRTTPDGAAELINKGTISASTQLCYTRIIMVKGTYYQFGLPLSCPISNVFLSDNSTLKYTTGWLLRAYSESKRAAQGAEGKNWETLKAAANIEGGKGYEMYSGSNYYREFYFPVNHADLANNKELTVTRTKDGAAGEKHAGWNVLVSPLTYTCNNDAEPEDMAICLMTSSGWEDQTVLEHIAPAQPFAYQAEEAGTISFVSATMPSLAPRRRIAAADESTRIQWIRLDVKDANGEGDETNIYSHPTRYEQYYQTGIDVAKQSLTAARARLYSSHAYGDMAFAGVSDELFEQGVALTVYSPAAQELTFSLRHNEWLNRLQYVWIIDFETGAMIDLLSSDYTAEVTEGTTYGRFYISGRFRTPQIATDIEPTSDSSLKGRAQKVLIEEKIYIMVGDKLYDATGKLVKGK